jgi:DNA-binding FadR family transcriptional regulator
LVCIKAAESCGPSDAKAMQKIVDAMEEALGDDRAYLRLNWSLHRMIADLVRNPALFAIYRTVIDILDQGLDDFTFEHTPRASIAIHRRLIKAISDGTSSKILAAVASHQKNSPLALSEIRGPIA